MKKRMFLILLLVMVKLNIAMEQHGLMQQVQQYKQ